MKPVPGVASSASLSASNSEHRLTTSVLQGRCRTARLGGCGGLCRSAVYAVTRAGGGGGGGGAPLGWEGVAGCTMAVYAVTRGGLRWAGRVWRAVLWQCTL